MSSGWRRPGRGVRFYLHGQINYILCLGESTGWAEGSLFRLSLCLHVVMGRRRPNSEKSKTGKQLPLLKRYPAHHFQCRLWSFSVVSLCTNDKDHQLIVMDGIYNPILVGQSN